MSKRLEVKFSEEIQPDAVKIEKPTGVDQHVPRGFYPEDQINDQEKMAKRLEGEIRALLESFDFISVDNLINLVQGTDQRLRKQLQGVPETFGGFITALDEIKRPFDQHKAAFSQAVAEALALSPDEFLARARHSFFGILANDDFRWSPEDQEEIDRRKQIYTSKIEIYEKEKWVTKDQADRLRTELEHLIALRTSEIKAAQTSTT